MMGGGVDPLPPTSRVGVRSPPYQAFLYSPAKPSSAATSHGADHRASHPSPTGGPPPHPQGHPARLHQQGGAGADGQLHCCVQQRWPAVRPLQARYALPPPPPVSAKGAQWPHGTEHSAQANAHRASQRQQSIFRCVSTWQTDLGVRNKKRYSHCKFFAVFFYSANFFLDPNIDPPIVPAPLLRGDACAAGGAQGVHGRRQAARPADLPSAADVRPRHLRGGRRTARPSPPSHRCTASPPGLCQPNPNQLAFVLHHWLLEKASGSLCSVK